MTLVIGLQREQRAVLIADSCITYGRSFDRDVDFQAGLKTGGLFPGGGCLYGLAGDSDEGLSFVRAVREKLAAKHGFSHDVPVEKRWESFAKFVQSYPSKRMRRFEMLLTTRHTKCPQLYRLRSGELSQCRGDLEMIGAGTNLLRPMLSRMDEEAWPRAFKEFKGIGLHPIYPYCFNLCAALTAMAHGPERPELEAVGVGGVFYYVDQFPESEARQKPADYLLVLANGPRINVLRLRVMFAPDGYLIIDRPEVPPTDPIALAMSHWAPGCTCVGNAIDLLPATRGARLSLRALKLLPRSLGQRILDSFLDVRESRWRAVAEKIVPTLLSEPAWFVGLCFLQPQYRNSLGGTPGIWTSGTSTWFDAKTGWCHPDLEQLIRAAVDQRITPPDADAFNFWPSP